MITKLLEERNAALTTLDVTWAKERFPTADEHTLLMSLHKARYECTAIAPELRHASGAWLRASGYHRMNGLPLLPEGELPE